MLNPVRQREIFWLDDCEPLDGEDDKDRPVIVLSSPGSLRTATSVLVVACTTHPRKQDVPRYEIPRTKETGLPKKCWALPRWYLKMNRYRLKETKGLCPMNIFVELLQAVQTQIDADERQNQESPPT